MSQNEHRDVFPLSGDGPSLTDLRALEGDYVFRCAECIEVFDTVLEWAEHALANHRDTNPGVEPVRKQ